MSDSQRKKFPAGSSATKGQAELPAGPAERLSTISPESQAPCSTLGFVQQGGFEGHKYCLSHIWRGTKEWKIHLAEGERLQERAAAAGASSPRRSPESGRGNPQSCSGAVEEAACPAPCGVKPSKGSAYFP